MSPGSLLERSNVMTLAFIIYAIACGVASVLGDLPFTDYRDGLIAFGGVVIAGRAYLAGKRIEKAPTPTDQIPGEDNPITGIPDREMTDEPMEAVDDAATSEVPENAPQPSAGPVGPGEGGGEPAPEQPQARPSRRG